ncbi:MAG: sodium-dependent transporter [Lachnospiraceae bacterium]|nr:sodium-dependent transporter [Lachnospiraceae bacterium]
MEREKFASRLGFILISAGCAIGLGNVWRFPYITGMYGGAAFVLIYLLFLLILGLPILVMEFAVGRASQKSAALSFDVLEPKGTKWHWYKYGAMAGNYLLMMFYTVISGWLIMYFVKALTGGLNGLDAAASAELFGAMVSDPVSMTIYMVITVALSFGVCSLGMQNGVEKITKVMMLLLLFLMVAMAVHSVTLPGAEEGLKFYLYPDFSKLMAGGLKGLGESVYAAMAQSFFTLSLGIGAVAIFGSYIGKERRLTGEAISITILDTSVALMAGLIIIPACFAYGVNPDSGPDLLFITLPTVFSHMPVGQLWASLFFLFMCFAALSTVIAVFENIIAFAMDLKGWSRGKAVLVNLVVIILLSMPCVLGFNVWSDVRPLGGNIMDLEDFIVSNNLLPLGSLIYLMFCTSRYGWGWDKFLEEANAGAGIRFPKWIRFYVKWILPVIVLVIFVQGYIAKFF